MGGHFSIAATIFVLITLAAMSAVEANATLRVTSKLVDNYGIGQPLPYTYLYVRDSSSQPMEKHFYAVDYIFGPASFFADLYVRFQPEPCSRGDYTSPDPEEWIDPNYCGPTKYLAQERTGPDGSYMILMVTAGIYYIVVSVTPGDQREAFFGNPTSTYRKYQRQSI